MLYVGELVLRGVSGRANFLTWPFLCISTVREGEGRREGRERGKGKKRGKMEERA